MILRLSVTRIPCWMFRCQRDDQCRIRSEEKIADGHTPPVSDPALREVVRPVVQHVAALTKRAQIRQPVVRRVAIKVRRREHDTRLAKLSCFHKIRPAGWASSTVAPRRRSLIEPTPIR